MWGVCQTAHAPQCVRSGAGLDQRTACLWLLCHSGKLRHGTAGQFPDALFEHCHRFMRNSALDRSGGCHPDAVPQELALEHTGRGALGCVDREPQSAIVPQQQSHRVCLRDLAVDKGPVETPARLECCGGLCWCRLLSGRPPRRGVRFAGAPE